MLTQKEIEIVQADWRSVLPIAAAAATMFYDRLFELDPGLRPLFKSDLSEQKKKLVQMLGTAVSGLNDLAALAPAVRALGARHAAYGVKPEHYASVGSALLWTLKKGLGPSFDTIHETAWRNVYSLLAETMQSGAQEKVA